MCVCVWGGGRGWGGVGHGSEKKEIKSTIPWQRIKVESVEAKKADKAELSNIPAEKNGKKKKSL